MTGIFKGNNPSNTFLLFIYGLLLKLPWFFNPVVPVSDQPDGFFYRTLLQWLQPFGNSFPAIYPILTLILFYTQALMINRIVNEQRLLIKNNYLPAMTYLLITSLFTEWNTFSASLIINSLLIWVLAQLCKLTNTPNPKSLLLNIGIISGLATFFYFPSIAFFLLIIMGLIITRPFRLAEWLMALFGLIAPYYFLFSWLYLTDTFDQYSLPDIGLTLPAIRGSNWAFVAIILVLITMLMGMYFIQQNYRKQLVHTRKSWGLIVFYFIVSLFVPFLNETNNFQYWLLCAVPISILSSAAFMYPERKWFPAAVHWTLVALVIVLAYL